MEVAPYMQGVELSGKLADEGLAQMDRVYKQIQEHERVE